CLKKGKSIMNRREMIKGALAAPLTTALLMRDSIEGTTATVRGPRADYFPNFILRTQEDKKMRFYDDLVQGKIVLFNFFYADCQGTCPATTANLLKVQKLLGDHVGRDYHM